MPDEAESIALIQAAGAVIVAAIGAIGTLGVIGYRRLARRSDDTRFEITNDHDTPLREDMDRKHGEVVRILVSQGTETRRDIGGLREEIRELRRADRRLGERIERVEDTFDPRKQQRHD